MEEDNVIEARVTHWQELESPGRVQPWQEQESHPITAQHQALDQQPCLAWQECDGGLGKESVASTLRPSRLSPVIPSHLSARRSPIIPSHH